MMVSGCKRVEVSAYWRDQVQQNYMGGASGTWGGGGVREICKKRNTWKILTYM